MKRKFVYKDDSSHKFWEIELKDKSYTTYYGKVGSKARSDVNTYETKALAKEEFDKKIDSKLKKGYKEVVQSEPDTNSTNGLIDQLKKLEKLDKYEEKRHLEREIVLKYGVEALEKLFGSKNRKIFSLANAPKDFPWYDKKDSAIVDIIDSTIGQLEGTALKQFIKELENLCFLIVGMKVNNKFYLVYCTESFDYKKNKRVTFFVGGEPNPSPELSKEAQKIGWECPESLSEFYSIHDGFGGCIGHLDKPDGVEGLYSSHAVLPLGKIMNPIAKEQNNFPKDYEFNNLLEFSPDGFGNSQCFYRKDKKSKSTMTVDWDHETWEISEERDFFDFINEKIMFTVYEE